MRKKLFSMLLVTSMALSMMLSGCGKSGEEAAAPNNEASSGAEAESTGGETESASGELTNIKMVYMIFNTSAPDMGLVQDEINKISEKEIGVHVTIEPIAVGEYANQVNLMLTSGEELDIIQAFSTNYNSYCANGSLTPIESELETYGKGIIEALGTEVLKAGQVGGHQYGITTNRDLATGYGFAFRTDLLEKYSIDASAMKTLADIEKALAVIKEKEPDLIPLTLSTEKSLLFNAVKYGVDPLGDSLGVLMDMTADDLKVENLFETERYQEFVKTMRGWYQKGYIQSDAPTSSEVGATLMKTGGAFGENVNYKAGLETQLKTETGYDMTVVNLYPADTSTSTIQILQYAVAQNSENPAKAVEFLNLLYTNPDVANLLSWGIEGKHYVKTEDGHITFPEGVDATNSGYNLVQGWLVGNQFITHVWEGDSLEVWKNMEEFNKSATVSKAMGFSFDSSSVKTEYAACTAVLTEYRCSLECGAMDPDTALKEMNDKLYASGLQKIIDEKQKQLDEWKANN